MKLSIKGMALACAIIWSLLILLVTLLNMITGTYGEDFVFAMSSVYLGYDSTFIGLIVGIIWAIVDGAIGGVIFAWLYNRFVD